MNKRIMAVDITASVYPNSGRKYFTAFVHRELVRDGGGSDRSCEHYDRLSSANIRRIRAMQNALVGYVEDCVPRQKLEYTLHNYDAAISLAKHEVEVLREQLLYEQETSGL